MAKLTKIDSNSTGLRYAEEASFKVLPAAPVWNPMEPNSYNDFGGNPTLVARNPINPSRQRKKGVITDLDATGGLPTDFTQTNLQDLLQGFFFADFRRKAETGGYIGRAAVPVISTTATLYNLSNRELTAVAVAVGGTGYVVGDVVAITETGGTNTTPVSLTVAAVTGGVVTSLTITNSGRYSVDPTNVATNPAIGGTGTGLTMVLTFNPVLTFAVNDLINAGGFTNAANDGVKVVTAVNGTQTQVTVGGLVVEASPPAAANLVTVGRQLATATLDVVVSGALPVLNRASGAVDFTSFGLTPGEMIFIGGDTAAENFGSTVNNGFKRVLSVSATGITLDKSDSPMVAETGTGKTIRLYFGRVLKNEIGTLIKRRTYQLERTLGAPDDALPTQVQAEYLEGAVPSEFTMNIPTADKLTADVSFVAADSTSIDAPTALKTGTRPALDEADAFNTSSDFSRIKLSQYIPGEEAPAPLFAFSQEITITLNNNVSPNKAVGVLGAFEVTTGTFQIGGSITAYFADVAALSAVRNNVDITLDMAVVKANAGWSLDIPLMSLGDGRPNVEQDTAITLPLNMEAATGAKIDPTLDHTAMLVFWDYLPTVAAI